MLNTVLGITIAASIAAYFGYWRLNVHRRRKYAWDLLTAYLEPGDRCKGLNYPLRLDQGVGVIWGEKWRSVQGANGLWSMYVNAGIMLDTANFLAQNCEGIDRGLLESLRSDATQVRAYVLIALSKYACSQVNECALTSASRATAYYTDMLNGTTQLLDGNGVQLAFSSVGRL
jgi:hypothetical protein